MPAIYWLPLPGVREPAALEHVHAAFTEWFDDAAEHDAHHDNVKPYRLAPLSTRNGIWGVEVSLLTEKAFTALATRIEAGASVRLGRVRTRVETPLVVLGESWADLAHWRGDDAWKVTFLTPFAARTGNRTSPFPTPGVVLRPATDAWAHFSGLPPLRVAAPDQAHLWVSHVELSTTTVALNGHKHPGALGTVVYRADSPEVARTASSLFRLAAYCGMGSFRGKGMGVVAVEPR